MARSAQRDAFRELDSGNVVEYVERRLFGGKIDSLAAHIERKKALAEPTRYSILYLLYEYGEISRKRLVAKTGREGNQLQHHLRELLDANLIAELPAPSDADGRQTYYRITTLGKQEIASDVEHVLGGYAHEDRFQLRGDPELVDGVSADGDRRRRVVEVDPADIQEQQTGLRSRHHEFQLVHTPE